MASGVSTKRKPPARAVADTRALYFYGVTQDCAAERVSAEGVDGDASVEALPRGGLLCWVSRVSRAEFADGLRPSARVGSDGSIRAHLRGMKLKEGLLRTPVEPL